MHASNPLKCYLIIVIFLILSTELKGHEFWIEPESFIVKKDGEIKGNLRVGQMMKGTSYGYYPKNFKRFQLKKKNVLEPLQGRLGDNPAISAPAQGDHLVTIIHETSNSIVHYDNWNKFDEFLKQKNLLSIKKMHLKNNFPKSQFKEIYSRYAKALIGSGSSLGSDIAVGLETELVALSNPYVDDLSNGIVFELLYKGLPQKNKQIEIFSRNNNGEVSKKTTLTNINGQAKVQVKPQTDYMINSVIMRTPNLSQVKSKNDNSLILWESLWASITFRVP